MHARNILIQPKALNFDVLAINVVPVHARKWKEAIKPGIDVGRY